ncbi:MAG: monovalent cation/H+ antiporter complex subunit F, partial [Oryzihumus sp.]
AEVVVALLLLLRLALGPTTCDRVVAVNALATQCAVAVLLFAASADRSIYLDVSIWLASFSYLGTIIWARYLEREFL